MICFASSCDFAWLVDGGEELVKVVLDVVGSGVVVVEVSAK